MTPFETIFTGITNGELSVVKQALYDNPDLLHVSVIRGGTWLHYAARCDKLDMVAMLVEAGIDVNAPRIGSPDGPLIDAIHASSMPVVRWLLDHGAKVNTGGGNRGTILVAAINTGSLELVRLLLERGADPNLTYGSPPKNAFTHALQTGRQDMINLLRDFGGKETSYNLLSSRSDQHNQVLQHFTKFVGPIRSSSLHEIVPGIPPIAIQVADSSTDHNVVTLFTVGMSDRPMVVPQGQEAFRYAELFIRLPANWPLASTDLLDSNNCWPIDWLRKLAHFPHDNRTWLGGSQTLVDNGDPPKPFATRTPFTSMLLLTSDSEFGLLRFRDGRVIHFYTLIPLYKEERDLEKQIGIVRLIQHFQKAGISTTVDVSRPNVAFGI